MTRYATLPGSVYTVGSLFTGIGGIDLAFTWAGFEIAYQVEVDDYCNRVLKRHWPTVPRYRDVRLCTGRSGKGWRRYDRLPRVDVLAGGFPCTDISAAGKGAGIESGERSGLWFEYWRLIADLRPRVVFLENVPAILVPGRGGDIVTAALAALGYVGTWGVISAADAGAGHQRDRWWCVAYAGSARGRHDTRRQETGAQTKSHSGYVGNAHDAGWREQCGAVTIQSKQLATEYTGCDMGDTECSGCSRQSRWRAVAQFANGHAPDEWLAQSRMGRGADGLSGWLDIGRINEWWQGWPAPPGPQYEWEPPRTVEAGTTVNRPARLKALGNAVVPQVVYPLAVEIRRALEEFDA